VFIEEENRFRQTYRQVSGVTAYPFNRAFRAEFTGGFRSIDFDREIRTRVISPTTGELLAEEIEELPSIDTVNLAETAAALVYDTAILGPTSPLAGSRSRLEVAPIFGGLSLTTFLADVRQYFMPVRPVTIAGRILHYGRYGPDAEDARLAPLYLGYSGLVRGYDFDSFDAGECEPTAASPCPVYDRLVGSRVAVANLEVRFPLVGVFTGELEYGPVPIEGLVFADAGVAWGRLDEPTFFGGDREVVRSVGAGVRVNALGFAILELAAARPLDRPEKGWLFSFNFQPGF
jgi:hypothetical protein